METATFTFELYNGSTWVDISADVRSDPAPMFKRGLASDDPTSLVASVGIMKIFLDNSIGNSAAKSGYYSPGHANVMTGFSIGARVRLKTVYSSATRYQFHGRISDIEPVAGKYRSRRTQVTVTDYMEELSSRYLPLLSIQASKNGNQLVTTVINAMDIAPLATSFDTGLDTFTSAFYDLQGEKQTAISVLQKICQSDVSKFWIVGDATGGETLRLVNRQSDIGKTSSLTLNDAMTEMEVSYRKGNIYNKVAAVARKPNPGTSPEVLYSLPTEKELRAGGTWEFTALFRDPDGGVRVNGKDVVDPLVADTDYKFSSVSGSGNDMNSDLSVTLTIGSDRADVVIQNNHATRTGYLWLFAIRGTILRLRDPIEISTDDATSISAYGERRLSFVTPYQNNDNTAADIANYFLSKWKDPRRIVDSVEFIGNKSSTLMTAAINLDLGDMITIVETQTGTNMDKIIIGLEKTITPKGNLKVQYKLTDSNSGAFWLLGTAGFSELGETTTLGF